MSLQLLFDGQFEAYFATLREGSPNWLMVHVPKTAGSSLVEELGALLKPYYKISIRGADHGIPHGQRFEQAVNVFLEKSQTRRFRFASGHIVGDHAERILQALPGTRAFAMLRHPVNLFVSDFRYQRSEMHGSHLQFREKYPDFDSFVHARRAGNKITRHLVPRRIWKTKDASKCLDFMMNTYDFLGLQEQYALSFRVITTMVGAPTEPTVASRVNTPDAEPAVDREPRAGGGDPPAKCDRYFGL